MKATCKVANVEPLNQSIQWMEQQHSLNEVTVDVALAGCTQTLQMQLVHHPVLQSKWSSRDRQQQSCCKLQLKQTLH
jgi:hypothetical protein